MAQLISHDKWFIVDSVEEGIHLMIYSNQNKLKKYLEKNLKFTIRDIRQATKDDYNWYFYTLRGVPIE